MSIGAPPTISIACNAYGSKIQPHQQVKTIWRQAVLVILTTGVLASSRAAGAEEQPFTFAKAEFMPIEQRLTYANEFVAKQLPVGLPLSEAIARVEKADASCSKPSGPAATVVCSFYIVTRPRGGDLGENWWTVRLVSGPDGLLQSASVDRSRVGDSGGSQ